MSYVCVCSCAREANFKTRCLYCHRTLRLTSPLRAVEFSFLFHSSYTSSFSLVVSSASGLRVSGDAFNCIPHLPVFRPDLPLARLLQNLTMSLNPTIEKKHIRPLSVGPLILLHPVSTGPWRIIPFTSSNRKCIHYEPNALGSQIPV